ncbi:hypothetical protein SAMN04515647_3161 [Cohaesibacter sp. ES.047]|uniref:hypothetical protein n=1 Tax=Cohaesibacter sp. ES.047 TaxID=1798205 RepID=UPI000BB6A0E2|nr:hypothetical protein [Cohaesibacter sp. ES.047]SNY92896.1 hypothetical protein SAMN04515647_3161 [Cohaesibacter sp. ES.047]
MQIETATFTKDGTIQATIDGQAVSIPDDMANRHRKGIAAWEADGHSIAPYDEGDEKLVALTPRQLRLALSRAGYLDLVEPALEAIEDPTERQEALIEWQYASLYQPDNPLVESIRLALGLSESETETLWRSAQDT